jgi:hypothetical protein
VADPVRSDEEQKATLEKERTFQTQVTRAWHHIARQQSTLTNKDKHQATICIELE